MVPDPIDFCIAQDMVALRVNPDIIYNRYLLTVLRSHSIQKQIEQTSVGDVIPHFKKSFFDQLLIPIPKMEIQRIIGDYYFAFSNKIELNQRINENLERQARAIYHKWLAVNFGKFELHMLSEIAIINPDTYSPKESWEYFNYLDTSSITNGDVSEIQHFTQTEKLPSRARRKVINGDIVFSTVRPNQKHFGMIFSALPNMLVSTGFAVIRSTLKRVCNELIYLQITEDAFIEKMQQLAEQSTSTFPSIKPSDIGNYLVPCPSEQDGLELSKQLKAIFTLAAIKREENEKLSALRDILLPKLMVGEIDVSAAQLKTSKQKMIRNEGESNYGIKETMVSKALALDQII